MMMARCMLADEEVDAQARVMLIEKERVRCTVARVVLRKMGMRII